MKNKDNFVAILLINWNQSNYTIECIESLLKIETPKFKIFILDNNSNRSEIEKLDSYISSIDVDISLIKEKENLGFTGGNNKLVDIVLKDDNFTHILFLNNDTIVEPNFLEKLIKHLNSDNKIGSIGPLILQGQNRNIVDSAGSRAIIRLAQPILLDHGQKYIKKYFTKEVDYITGTALLMPIEVIKKVGAFDNNFFAYFEDFDLGVRINKFGYKNIFFPESIIYHYGSVSTGNKSKNYYYFSFRNRIRFALKYQSKLNFFLIFLPYLIIWKIVIKFLLEKNKINFIKGAYRAILDSIKNRPTKPL